MSQLLSLIRPLARRELAAWRCRPQAATLELTYRCNLHCQMCHVPDRGLGRAADELTTDELIGLVDDLRQIGVTQVGLVGAEPLMRRDLAAIIAAVVARGIQCELTTNGTLLNRQGRDVLFETGLQALTVSVDAPDTRHDVIRGKAALHTVVDGLASVLAARAARGTRRPQINVHCTLSRLNAGVIPDMVSFCEQLGVDSLSFQYLAETCAAQVAASTLDSETVASRRFIPAGESLRLFPEQVGTFREQARVLRAYRGRLHISHRAISALPESALLAGGPAIDKCYWIRTHLIVDPYGDVLPCANVDAYVYGNVRHQPVADIWQGAKARAFRATIRRSRLPVCQACCHFAANWTLLQMARFILARSL